MGFIQPLSTMTDVLVLAFLLGIAAAALIYVPMLRRARNRLAAQRACTHSLSRGPHALRDPSALRTDSTTASATAVTVLATQRRSTGSGRPTSQHTATGESPAAARSTEEEQANADLPTAPQPRIVEPATVPQIPTGLFQQHYEAKFTRAQQRIARIRAELSE